MDGGLVAVVVSSSSAWLMDGGSSLPVCRPFYTFIFEWSFG